MATVLSRAELLLQAKNYSGSGDWLDEANSHDAQFGSTAGADTNDPQILAWSGSNYLWLPGVAGNNVAVTLAVTTVYDYTVTYTDNTTATGSVTSDGGGVALFGETDANLVSLKVKQIDVVPSGGGATLALFDASLATEPFATLTDSLAKVWTFNRSGSGLYLVDQPAFGLHTDDYFEIPDDAGLDFANADQFTVMVVASTTNIADSAELISKKASAGSAGIGWYFERNSAAIYPAASDGTTVRYDIQGTLVANTRHTYAGRFDGATREIEAFIDGVGSGTPTTYGLMTGTLENTEPLLIGAIGTGGYWSGKVMAVAVWREALSDADIATAVEELVTDFLTATITSTSTVTVDLDTIVELSATADTQSTVTANLAASIVVAELAATVTAISTTTGGLTSEALLSATIATVSAVTSALQQIQQLGATTSTVSTLTAALTTTALVTRGWITLADQATGYVTVDDS